jgi:hypothetical protein
MDLSLRRSALLGLAAGALLFGVGLTVTGRPSLALALGGVYAVAVGTYARHRTLVSNPGGPYLSVATSTVLLAALVGVPVTLSADLRYGLGLLVLGVGYAAFALGVGYAQRRLDGESATGEDRESAAGVRERPVGDGRP